MKKKWLLTLVAAFVMALSFCEPVQEVLGTEIVAEAASVVKAPAASKKSGTYTVGKNLKISLSCDTKGADIYYSLNGGKYKRYTKSISIEKNSTLKVYSKKGSSKSKTVSYSYKLSPEIKISKKGGKYSDTITVKLSSETSGVKFCYTLDGSKPTEKSKKYTSSGIKISKTSKLRVIAYKKGWTSNYLSEEYTISKASASAKSILDDYTKKYIYSSLNARQKQLYKALFEGVSEFRKEIDVQKIKATIKDLDTVFTALQFENPQLFWLDTGWQYYYYGNMVTSVLPEYSRTKSEAEKIRSKLEKAANKIINKALSYDKLFDRVLYIHDTLINNTDYTRSGGASIRCADGPILNGKALCAGYSKAFSYLCQSIGLDTISVAGNAGEPHEWNMIKLDGKWYNVDVTFDDPVGGDPVCNHDYFCITTKKISEDHKFENYFKIPSATATEYDYYKNKGITVYKSYDKALAALYKTAASNYKKGIKRTEIVCDKSIIEKVFKALEKDLFKGLEKYGCYPKGTVWYGFNGNTIYIEF